MTVTGLRSLSSLLLLSFLSLSLSLTYFPSLLLLSILDSLTNPYLLSGTDEQEAYILSIFSGLRTIRSCPIHIPYQARRPGKLYDLPVAYYRVGEEARRGFENVIEHDELDREYHSALRHSFSGGPGSED